MAHPYTYIPRTYINRKGDPLTWGLAGKLVSRYEHVTKCYIGPKARPESNGRHLCNIRTAERLLAFQESLTEQDGVVISLLNHIRGVAGSDIDRDTSNLWFSSVPQGECHDSTSIRL
jgi:hypothetical protein